MSQENTIFTKSAYLSARERFIKRRAARQAAAEIIARIVTGAPRESFGDFTVSFDEIERRVWGMTTQSRRASGAGRERNFG
jgi:hypothetical protein